MSNASELYLKRPAAMTTTTPKKTTQMTIFYGGQIIVFNDMPARKAMEVMRLASSVASSKASPGLSATPTEIIAKISPREIPIARKQSLARFFEKRKDRIMARSPYSANGSTKGTISGFIPAADKSWLGLAGS